MALFNVLKFGGTSLSDFAAMERCASVVGANRSTRVVVVSASAKVTNFLVQLGTVDLDDIDRQEIICSIQSIQENILSHVPNSEDTKSEIYSFISKIRALSLALAVKLDLASFDELVSIGEQMSSRIFVAVLRSTGINAQLLNAKDIIRTDDNFGNAEPDVSAIKTLVAEKLLSLADNTVWVTQGFIGGDKKGRTTTLGRGGSDYSAALIAEALGASELQIWTDVSGMFSTDPRIESQAICIPEISFNEAAEMATFGAKVLHPKTLSPAINANIPVFVGSSSAPDAGGTHILPNWKGGRDLKAVALRRNQVLLTLTSFNMLHTYGFLAKAFEILSTHKVSVDLVTTSEVSVALTFDEDAGKLNLNKALLKDLEKLGAVKIDRNLALVAVIGNNIDRSSGIAATLFSGLRDINLRLICHGASQHNLCFLVDEDVATDVVRRVHKIILEKDLLCA